MYSLYAYRITVEPVANINMYINQLLIETGINTGYLHVYRVIQPYEDYCFACVHNLNALFAQNGICVQRYFWLGGKHLSLDVNCVAKPMYLLSKWPQTLHQNTYLVWYVRELIFRQPYRNQHLRSRMSYLPHAKRLLARFNFGNFKIPEFLWPTTECCDVLHGISKDFKFNEGN